MGTITTHAGKKLAMDADEIINLLRKRASEQTWDLSLRTAYSTMASGAEMVRDLIYTALPYVEEDAALPDEPEYDPEPVTWREDDAHAIASARDWGAR